MNARRTIIVLSILVLCLSANAGEYTYDLLPGLLDKQGATEEYVDSTLGGIYFNYFLSDTATGEGSPLDTLDLMYPAETGAAASTVTKLITADATLVNAWVTEAAEPTFTVLVPGTYTLYTHANVDNDGATYKDNTIYWVLQSCDADGQNPVTLITSEESSVLTDTSTAYILHGSLAAQTVIGATDRLILNIYANEGATTPPNDPTVTITMEGDHDCRLAILTTSTALDDRYINDEADVVDSTHYIVDSIDNEHINWTDIDFLDDEGAVDIAAYAARGAFESGDSMLILEAGVGIREIDYDDLPGSPEVNNLETVCTGIAVNEIFIGTGADAGNYALIGGELGGTWASPTIDDGLAVTNWNLTTPTITNGATLTGVKKRVYISASAGLSPTTTGCADAAQTELGTTDINRINLMTCDFDASSDEYWIAHFTLPENYDGGTFTAAISWTCTADAAKGVAWFVQMLGMSSGDVMGATNFGTAVEINDDGETTNDYLLTAESAAITENHAGGSGTTVGGQELWIKVYRDVSDADDDLTTDGKFIGIWLTFGIDQLSTED